jgi:hypothetical protein
MGGASLKKLSTRLSFAFWGTSRFRHPFLRQRIQGQTLPTVFGMRKILRRNSR